MQNKVKRKVLGNPVATAASKNESIKCENCLYHVISKKPKALTQHLCTHEKNTEKELSLTGKWNGKSGIKAFKEICKSKKGSDELTIATRPNWCPQRK